MELTTVDLFDKIINIQLIANDGQTDTIICPSIGIKPDINLSGEFVPSNTISKVDLRLTNFYTKRPLSDYTTNQDTGAVGYISITAGYKTNLVTNIYGECLTAYQESPNPDGVTCFEIMIGEFGTWVNSKINFTMQKGQTFNYLLTQIKNSLNMDIKFGLVGLPTTLNLNFHFNGYVKDLIYKIMQMFPNIVIRPSGKTLYVYDINKGTGIKHILKYLTDAHKVAGKFTITAPWIPDCLPGDTVELDPKIYTGSFGSEIVPGTLYEVFKHSFNFSTNEGVNEMTLECGSMA
jgi:hypothetical protein